MRETEIFPVGYRDEIARENFETAVLDGVPQSVYRRHTDSKLDNPGKIWGYREKGIGTWRQLSPGDYLLFYPGDWEYRYAARISGKEKNRSLGEKIFQTPDEPFEYIVYLDRIHEVSIDSRQLHMDFAGYNIGHPIRSQPFNDRTYEVIQDRYKSVKEYIDAYRVDSMVVSADEFEHNEKAFDVERPKRIETNVARIIRNTKIIRELKDSYNYQCQFCGEVRQRAPSKSYAEGHHIHPLGDEPPGPDKKENIIILCPNHHSDFDYGMVRVDVDTLKVNHAYDSRVDGKRLTLQDNHSLNTKHLRYHNENKAAFKLM